MPALSIDIVAVLLIFVLLASTMSSLAAGGTGEQTPTAKVMFRLRVVDTDEKLVAGVRVGEFANWSDPDKNQPDQARPSIRILRHDRTTRTGVSDEAGIVAFFEDEWFDASSPGDRTEALYAYEPKRQLVGLIEVGPGDTGKEKTLKLEPACRVTGKITSAELEKLGRKVQWTNVYAFWGKMRPLSCDSFQKRFEIFLPPGDFELSAYGGELTTVQKPIRIKPGQRELIVDIDLPPTRLAILFGKPAPELTNIKDWKNGGPLTLAALRGKPVLLDFWGYWCGPCVHSMPELIKLYDACKDKGVVILAIHDDSVESIQEMDDRLATARKDAWGGRDLPFLVALDGGGKTKVEGLDRTCRGATTAAFGIEKFPTTIIIDKDGRVIEEIHPSAR